MRSILSLLFLAGLTLGLLLWGKYAAVETAPNWRGGELVVILPPAESLDRQFDEELAEMFAVHVGATLRPLVLYPNQAMSALARHQAHLSAIGMRSNDNADAMMFSPSYQTLREKIVCSTNPPRRPEDLTVRYIAVTAGSAQEAALRVARRTTPSLRWTTYDHKLPSDLLHAVGDGNMDCTIANEEEIATMRNFHPDMAATFDIAEPSRLAWTFAPDADPELLQLAREFFEGIRQDGTLHRLLEQYYGYNQRLMPEDAAAFLTHTRTLLPHYRRLFEEAATLTGIEWQWIAAMAYRESHWNPLATSPTGVRGMMMLTGETADRMNVDNRLDARESVLAGARYLQLLKENLPPHIVEPDRTWLALAAYNQGSGHLEDARILAERRGLDPDSWVDVKKVLPLLKDPNREDQFKYGNARGGEAVIFVETVRLYYDMLKRLSRSEMPPPTLYSLLQEKKSQLQGITLP